MILFRFGKAPRCAFAPGGFSDNTRPCSPIERWSSRCPTPGKGRRSRFQGRPPCFRLPRWQSDARRHRWLSPSRLSPRRQPGPKCESGSGLCALHNRSSFASRRSRRAAWCVRKSCRSRTTKQAEKAGRLARSDTPKNLSPNARCAFAHPSRAFQVSAPNFTEDLQLRLLASRSASGAKAPSTRPLSELPVLLAPPRSRRKVRTHPGPQSAARTLRRGGPFL
jgi:hypothetical protein